MRVVALFLFCAACEAQQAPLRLSLAAAEQMAIQRNPRFQASQFTAKAAAQAPIEARSAYFPLVSGNVTGVGADNGSRLASGALNNPVVYSRAAAGLTVNQLLTDFGRTSNLTQAARFRAQAEDQATEATRANILLETARAYFAVLRALAVQQVARETVRARQVVTDQVDALTQNKLKSLLDLSFAKVNLADAQLFLSEANNSVDAAKAQLATAIGTPQQTDFVLEDSPLPPAPPPAAAPFLQQAIAQRPELAGLRLEQQAAESFTKAERALSLPTLSAIATAGYVPAGEPQVPGTYGAAGVNLSIPVLNGGLFKARRTEAEYRARAANQNVKDQENLILRDVRIAFLNVETAWDRVGLTAKLQEQATLALDLAQSRYNLGLGSIVEVSQSQLNVTSAQIASASAKYDYQAQRTALEFETGALR